MKVDVYTTDKKYNIIYADPPWSYKVWSGTGKTAANHYSCMKKDDIQNIPVERIACADSVLLLWVTFPCLQEGLELIKAWGFKYKTCAFTWVKKNKSSCGYHFGLGYWTRANAELCLLATKGHPKRYSRAVSQICDAHIREHSRKPDEIRDKIVQLCGDLPRIELFARQHAQGWDCWGNECEKWEECYENQNQT